MNHVWLVGSFEGTDAADVPAGAIDAFPGATFRHFQSPQVAAMHFDYAADVVLVVQHRPREFSSSDIAALIASQPLAHVLVGLGAWCASSARSEAAWPESIAVPLWEVPSSLRRISLAVRGGDPPGPWQTSGRDEVLLGEQEKSRAGKADAPIDIVVESPDRVLAESLRDIVSEFGVTDHAASASRLTLWDADPMQHRLPASLAELRQRRATDYVIALVDQPTRSTIDRLRRAGADAVIAKTFRVAELCAAIARCFPSPANDSAARAG